MVNYGQIEGALSAMFGAGPQGNPGAIHACAEQFAGDARSVAEQRQAIASHHGRLHGNFAGPAAERLQAHVQRILAKLQADHDHLVQLVRTLHEIADQLANDQAAHKRQVDHGRQQMIAEAKAADKK